MDKTNDNPLNGRKIWVAYSLLVSSSAFQYGPQVIRLILFMLCLLTISYLSVFISCFAFSFPYIIIIIYFFKFIFLYCVPPPTFYIPFLYLSSAKSSLCSHALFFRWYTLASPHVFCNNTIKMLLVCGFPFLVWHLPFSCLCSWGFICFLWIYLNSVSKI